MRFFTCFVGFFLSTVLLAQPTKTTFMPDNNLYLQDGLFDNGMTEQDFNNIIDGVTKYYAPIVEKFGATLIVNHLWTNKTVNAQAYQEGNNWYVNMYGGLARRSEITFDGFAMVLCHEIGHHLGGFPANDWAAYEGQADYFAMHSCAKTIWGVTEKEDGEESVIEDVNSEAKSLCDKYAKNDKQLCYREINAGLSLATLLGTLGGTPNVSISTPDKSVVKHTDSAHPKAQCRLDTYVAGTLCEIKWDNRVIPQTESESNLYLCSNKDYTIQARPKCWFHPSI